MYRYLKRVIDFSLSLAATIVLSPLFVIISLLIKWDSEGPVLYRGVRAGVGGRPFKMLKFRTMVANADRIGGPSTSGDDPRITVVGGWLRRHKLDEIPQLINVLKGEMSLVGPRPEVISEVEKYTREEMELLTVRPGITDWASIKFNDEGEILRGAADPHQAYLERIRPEKVRLGLEYIRKRSFLIDCQVIFQTAGAILRTRVG